MKKFICSFILVLILVPFAVANDGGYLDLGVSAVDAGDAKFQQGAQASLGFFINDNVSIKGDFGYSFKIVDANLSTERKYSYDFGDLGVEYLYQILPAYRLKIGGDFAVGYSFADVKSDLTGGLGDSGPRIKASFLSVVDLTQRLSFVLSLGYHTNFYYKDYVNSNIGGFTAVAALRINLFGVNRDIESSY